MEAFDERLIFLSSSNRALDSTDAATVLTILEMETAAQQLSLDAHCGDDLDTIYPGHLRIVGKPHGSTSKMC